MGQAFFDPNIKNILGPRLVSVFQDMTTFILWREHHHLNRSHPNLTQMDYCQSVSWTSHFAALNLPFEPQDKPNNMQEACRIAFLIFWNASNAVNRPGSILYRTLAAKLEHALERSVLQSFRERALGMLTWILLLGAFITDGQPESAWFITEIGCGLRDKERTTWREMEAILLQFLYLERIYQKKFELIWNDAIELSKYPI